MTAVKIVEKNVLVLITRIIRYRVMQNSKARHLIRIGCFAILGNKISYIETKNAPNHLPRYNMTKE